MKKSLFDPFDPDPGVPATPIKVLWDYENQVIVGDGMAGLFDTCWTYIHAPGATFPWVLSRFPEDSLFITENRVPEMVRLAVLVAS